MIYKKPENMVEVNDIAIMLKVNRKAVWNWCVRFKDRDFPPIAGTYVARKGLRPTFLFNRESIMDWLMAHKKIPTPEGYTPTKHLQGRAAQNHDRDIVQAIDKTLAVNFITGKHCSTARRKPSPGIKSHTKRITTQGVWPMVAL
jgi:hypothetical protein